MQYELKELNMNMGKLKYEMYQDIPVKESGSTNLCNGLPYEVFKKYLESQIARKYQNISYYDTKVITYIMYVNGLPVGYIGLRLDIDDNWRKWSGNFYYAIRLEMRNKGYCTKMLGLALDEFRKLGYTEIYGNSSNGNIGSRKVIENNGGIYLNEKDRTRYYKFVL